MSISKKTVTTHCCSLDDLLRNELLGIKKQFKVDFYQREYVWEKKQLEDLLADLANAFLKCWESSDRRTVDDVRNYDPYFMGEVILSEKSSDSVSAIIDGQQRITTFTLLLIYMLNQFNDVPEFPKDQIKKCIYDDNDYGVKKFNLDISDRRACMEALLNHGCYEPTEKDKAHVQKIVDRYQEIEECWDQNIKENNIVVCFAWWILKNIMFSKVVTNNDEFAYVIFETMNDRGLSLTQVEMLRSYLLANIRSKTDPATGSSSRDQALVEFDDTINMLTNIKLTSKSKAEFEFFRVFLRGHYAKDMSRGKGKDTSDFVMIGKAFHRWVREQSTKLLKLQKSDDFVDFVHRISYFAKQYQYIHQTIKNRDAHEHLYLIVNDDYGFTLQPALILSSIAYEDPDDVINEKIDIVSCYLTKLLTWRIWNQQRIAQSSLEQHIYDLCKKIRNLDVDELKKTLIEEANNIDPLQDGSPKLNLQNKYKLRVMLALITAIVARESGDHSPYMLNMPDIEIEHIWSNHFDQHEEEFDNEADFFEKRDNIGDLLLLPKTFNASYGDKTYEEKVEQYFSQNILARSLHRNQYVNNPPFMHFMKTSKLMFTSYDNFKKQGILERASLYKEILKWNWQSNAAGTTCKNDQSESES